MAAQDLHITRCYLHEGRPAVGDCARCGRPMCRQCSLDGDNTSLCISCPERAAAGKRRKEKGTARHEHSKAAARKTPATPKETAEEPLIPLVKRSPVIPGEVTAEPPLRRPARRPLTGKERRAGPLRRAHRPSAEENVPPVGRAGRGPGKEPDDRSERSSAGQVERGRWRLGRHIKAAMRNVRMKERFRQLVREDGTARQILFAVPYGLIASAGVLAIWLLIVFVRRQWSQFAILTAALAMSWALFKGTTIKKRDGKPVYDAPPKSLWLALTAIVILMVLTPIAELLAHALLYRGPDLDKPLSGFGANYFGALGGLELFVAFVLAFAVPFFLSAGKDLTVPAWMRRGKKSR